MLDLDLDVIGAKGSSKGASKTTKADAANTLRSRAKARITEILGEGEIVGLVDGAKSIFFDATPLANADGSLNFQGVTWEQRTGLPDQPALTGVTQTETPFQVGVEVKKSQTPPVRTIADQNADAVRVIMTIPALFTQDTKSGSILPADVDYMIQVRPHNGQWVDASRGLFQQQKNTAPYQCSHRVPLPAGGYPWDIQVVRINPDAPNENTQCSSIWDSYIVLVEGKFIYPNTALVSMELDAEQFGSSIPSRYYDVKGLIIQVPTNYDPEARTYNGDWDGSFKRAWSNNPAWVLYDLLSNARYGLGEFVDEDKIDKWGLYEIAQYCDQTVPDGFGGFETRYKFNTVINSRDEAFNVLQSITTAFRGMAFWSLGQVFAIADMPRDVDKVFSPANIIGHFNYSGTAKKARHSVAMVSWNDPQDFYRTAIEVVQDDVALDRYGWRQTDIQAVGCTSRGQAHRVGKWTLDTEHTSTETVEFECALDSLANDPIRPGHIIAVADPRKAQVRIGGRVVATPLGRVVLDKAFEPIAGETYRITVTLASGVVQSLPITGFDEGNLHAVVGQPFADAIVPGATWVITGTDVAPRQYRVLVAREEKKNTFRITALFHDPTKYARVDQGIVLDPIRYTRPRNNVKPPTNLAITETQYFQDGLPRSRLLISWTPGDDFLSSRYRISANTPDKGEVEYGDVNSTAFHIDDASAGTYTITVVAIGISGKTSVPVTATFDALGWSGVAGPEIDNLQVKGGGLVFSGKSASFTWTTTWPSGVTPYEVDYLVRIFDVDTNALVRMTIAPDETFTYQFDDNQNDAISQGLASARRRFRLSVSARDLMGRDGAPTLIIASNPAPEMVIPVLSGLSEMIFVEITEPTDPDWSGLLVWISETSGFNPLTTPPRDVFSTFNSFPAVSGTTYYVRVAPYDAFSKDPSGLNISPEQSVTATTMLFDTSDPGIPQGVVLTTEAEIAPDGTVTSVVRATWTTLTTSNLGNYEVSFSIGEGVEYLTDDAFQNDGAVLGAKWEKHGFAPGSFVNVSVRSVSKNHLGYSGDSVIASIRAALNTAPPAPPTNLQVIGGFERAYVDWINPTNKDLAGVEVWIGLTTNPAQAGRADTVSAPGRTFQDPNLGVTETRYYWIRSVNTSGLFSAFVGPASATSAALTAAKIAAGAIDASKFAASIKPIELVDALPTAGKVDGRQVYLKTDRKLYRFDGALGTWVTGVAAVDVAGALSNAQITSLDANKLIGQIVDSQIATLAANKLAGQLTDSQIAGLAATKIAGQLVASQIAAGSITTSKLSIASQNLVYNSNGKQNKRDGYQSGVSIDPGNSAAAIQPGNRPDNGFTGTVPFVILPAAQPPAAGTYGQILFRRPDKPGISACFPVVPNTRYELSAYLNTYSCRGVLYGDWYDAAANYLGRGYTSPEVVNSSGAQTRVGEFIVVPATAAFLAVNAIGYWTGASNAHLFVSAPMLAPVSPSQTELSPYVEDGVTQIDGGGIVTGSLGADRIVAGSITATQIAARGISADRLVANSITTTEIAAGSVHANRLQAQTITTNEIAAGSVHANRLVADSITAGEIAAGAISASEIAAGAITTSKLAITTSNKAFNGDCAFGSLGFTLGFRNTAAAPNGPAMNYDWQPAGFKNIYLHVPGAVGNRQVADMYHYDVNTAGTYVRHIARAGSRYEFSTCMSLHRCSGQIIIQWFGGDTWLQQDAYSSEIPANSATGGSVADFPRVSLLATAPAGTTSVHIIYRLITQSAADPYMFVSAMQFCGAKANQIEPSPYVDPGITAIDGGNIVTNTLHANRIVAGTITTDKLQAGAINADRIEASTFNAKVINTGYFNADYIAVGNGSMSSVINGSNSTKINGGAISANSIDVGKLKIGSRGIKTVGIEFYTERDGNGNLNSVIAWTAGSVLWTDDNGNPQATGIPAGRVGINGNYWYIWWPVGNPGFGVAQDNWPAILNDRQTVLMASVSGVTGLSVFIGGTIIDGTKITTRSLTADKIAVNQIQASHMAANSITGDRIVAGSLAADKITSGTLSSSQIFLGNGKTQIWSDGNGGRLACVNNANSQWRVVVGNLTPWTGDGTDYGLLVWDRDGNNVVNLSNGNRFIQGYALADRSIDNPRYGDGSISNKVSVASAGPIADAGYTNNRGVNVTVTLTAFYYANNPGFFQTTGEAGGILLQIDGIEVKRVQASIYVFGSGNRVWLTAMAITHTLVVGPGYHVFRAHHFNIYSYGSIDLLVEEISK